MADVKMKKISMENLQQAERKISAGKWRKVAISAVFITVISGGGYAAYRLIAGEIVSSKLTVTKMNCPACVLTVKEVTGKLPGVVETDVSLAAQDVTIKFREKQISPDQIKEAITRAGYPTKIDGVFDPQGSGKTDLVVALVNGKPVFLKDLAIPLLTDKSNEIQKDQLTTFFSTIGKEILLQAADKQSIVIQPQEVEEEIAEIMKTKNTTPEEFFKQTIQIYGSQEKYFQVVAQRLGIQKLINEHVIVGIDNPEEKNRKTLEWVGNIFKDADVKILDPKTREIVHASAGQDDWKTFWPRMIGSQSEIKTVLVN